MNQKVKDALNFDPFDVAEKITCEGSDTCNDTAGLGVILHSLNSESKKEILKETNDTHSGIKFSEFLSIATNLGFKEIFREQIPDTTDTFVIMWRSGILLRCESYWGDSVNSAQIYFNYQGPREGMFQCSNGYICELDGQPVFDGSCDVREGLHYVITTMEEKGKILDKWIKRPFLWLLNYMDVKVEGYNHDKINAKRIACFSSDIQKIIFEAAYK